MRYSFLSEAHEVISSWNCHGDLLTYSLGEALHLRLCRQNTHEGWTHPYTAHKILKGNAPNLDLLQQVSFTVSLCMTINIRGGAKKLPVHCNRALKTNTFAPSKSKGSSYGILIISSLLHPAKTQVREMSPAKPGSRDEYITLFFSLQRALSWLRNFPKLYFFHSSISSCSYLPKWMTCTGCSWLFISSHYPNREPFPWKCFPQQH